MKILFFGLSIFLTLSGTMAQDSGFVALFDGKTLTGWTASTENAESFSVADGSLVCKGGRAHLFYTGTVGGATFKNFELKLKARTTTGSNSGVYFHTTYQEKGWPDTGFEAQVNSTHTDPRKTGSLYGIVNIWAPGDDQEDFTVRVTDQHEVFVYRPRAPSTDGEWFDYHIIVQDQTITIKVNEKTTVEWTQPQGWSKNRKIGSGTIGLQAHDPDSEVHYKDISIKVVEE